MGESAASNEQIVSQSPFVIAPGIEGVRRVAPDSAVTVVSRTAHLKGDIRADGDVAVYGTVEGPITSAGRITVYAGGHVRGELKGSTVVINGEVEGEIFADVNLTIEGGAKIVGNFQTTELVVEPGATIQGMCQMSVRE